MRTTHSIDDTSAISRPGGAARLYRSEREEGSDAFMMLGHHFFLNPSPFFAILHGILFLEHQKMLYSTVYCEQGQTTKIKKKLAL